MKILFITDNFPPETNAPASRTFEHVSEWVRQGAEVTVVTCAPNFPRGKVFPGYHNSWFNREYKQGFELIRVKTYIAPNRGIFKRMIDFISFMIMSAIVSLFLKKHDVVIATSPQFFTAISGWFVAKIKKSKFIFEVRDIWPASLRAVGYNSYERIFSLFERIELFLYRSADAIVVVTQAFKSELTHRGIDEQKIEVVTNGVDTEIFHKNSQMREAFRSKFKLKEKFVVGYVGTLGMSHALETIINAAEKLPMIQFVFVGDGAKRKDLELLIEGRCLSNALLLPAHSKEEMPLVWNGCDIALVTLKDTPLFKTVIPSKIFECMATGTPIILSTPKGEATKIVEDNSVGICCFPENSADLCDKIKMLFNQKDMLSSISINAQITAKHYERRKLASNMLEIIRKVRDD